MRYFTPCYLECEKTGIEGQDDRKRERDYANLGIAVICLFAERAGFSAYKMPAFSLGIGATASFLGVENMLHR